MSKIGRKIIYENGKRSNSFKAHYAIPKPLKTELKDIKGRLVNEVGTYLEAIINHNKTHDYEVGFFGSVRIIVPVIEHLAFVLYGNKSRESRSKVLTSLGIKYPEIIWHIFRHPLIHGDEPAQLTVGKQVISWYIKLHNTEHEYIKLTQYTKLNDGRPMKTPIAIKLDIIKLYNDLLKYIDNLISQQDDKKSTFIIRESLLFQTKSKLDKRTKKYKVRRVNLEVVKEVEDLSVNL